MEWDSGAVVLLAAPFSEADLLVTLFTEGHGVTRGLVKGGQSRAKAPIFQPGNIVKARWVGRFADQLGQFGVELIRATAATILSDRLALAILQALASITAGALPERDPHPVLFATFLRLMLRLSEGEALLPDVVRYEADVLKDLGYGLDLAPDPDGNALAYVSPRTGRAISTETAGPWAGRLFPLPAFLLAVDTPSTREDYLKGLALTAHFLSRDAFGTLNRPLPAPRRLLQDLVAASIGAQDRPSFPA